MKLIRLAELFEQAAQKAKKAEIARVTAPQTPMVPQTIKPIAFYNPESVTKLGTVVGGQVLWKPVDRVARRVIQPAPWWAKILYGTTTTCVQANGATPKQQTIFKPNGPESVALRAYHKNGKAKNRSKKKKARKGKTVSAQIATPNTEREKLEVLKRLIAGEITAKEYGQLTEL